MKVRKMLYFQDKSVDPRFTFRFDADLVGIVEIHIEGAPVSIALPVPPLMAFANHVMWLFQARRKAKAKLRLRKSRKK